MLKDIIMTALLHRRSLSMTALLVMLGGMVTTLPLFSEAIGFRAASAAEPSDASEIRRGVGPFRANRSQRKTT